jgi:hypothetical protein
VEWSWPAWLISVGAVIASGAVAWAEGNWLRRPGLAMGFANHGGMWSDLVLLSMANAVVVPHLTSGPWLIGALLVGGLAAIWVHVFWYHPPSLMAGPMSYGETNAVRDNGDSLLNADLESEGELNVLSDHPDGAHSRSSRELLSDDEVFVPDRDIYDGNDCQLAADDWRHHAGDHMWPAHVRHSWWRDLSWSGWAHVVYVAGELALLVGFLLHPMPSDVVILLAMIFTIHVPIGLLQPRWYRTGHIATVSEQPLLAPLLFALWAVILVKL